MNHLVEMITMYYNGLISLSELKAIISPYTDETLDCANTAAFFHISQDNARKTVQ